MSKEKFNWKGLFVNEESSNKKVVDEKVTPLEDQRSSNTFPQSANSPSASPNTTVANSAILDTILEMYQSGFESLNKSGYDFYEFFKAIKAVNSNEPAVYKMALTMAQSVENKVSKDSLLNEAAFYIKEINKVHEQYSVQGDKKKSQILDTQKSTKDSLHAEIIDLEKRLIEIQNQVSEKKNQLQSLDIKLMSDVSEIDQKIIANNSARSTILESINSVVNGIKNNL